MKRNQMMAMMIARPTTPPTAALAIAPTCEVLFFFAGEFEFDDFPVPFTDSA